MTPAELTAWRSRMGWTAKKASQELGLSEKGYAAYERGWACTGQYRDGSFRYAERPIPKHVELACERLEQITKPAFFYQDGLPHPPRGTSQPKKQPGA